MNSNNFAAKMMRGEIARPPIAQTLNAEFLDFDLELKTLRSTFLIGDQFLNPIGHVQGGILSAMLDGTMGPAAGLHLEENQFVPTLNLNTSFIRPGKAGKFICQGKVINLGRTICYLSGELFDAEDKLVATATATAKIVTFVNK
ncbi:PaaI family thioesterase [Aurantivibrio infirmus]